MAVTPTPIFTQAPIIARARVAAANTARDGSGSPAALYTAAGSGARIDRIVITSAQASPAANSAMVARIFVSDAAGANFRLRAEVVIPQITASNTVIGSQSVITFPGGLPLLSGQVVAVAQSIYAGTQDQMDYIAEGGSF